MKMKFGISYLKTIDDVLNAHPRPLSVPLTLFFDKQNRKFRICRLGDRDVENLVSPAGMVETPRLQAKRSL